MILSSTSDIIRIVTSSTADIHVQASWADITTSAFTPGRTNTSVTSATTTTIVASPGASTQRQVKSLVIANRHASTSNTVTVQHYDGTTSISLYSRTLLAGESLQYDGNSWQPFNSVGTPVSIATAAPGDIQAFTSAGADVWTKPTSFTPTFVEVILFGGGGGGGAGASLATATIAKGGAGGGGGAYNHRTFRASDLSGTENVNVGAGGTAGAPGAAGALGGDGGSGGNSTFGTNVYI